MKSGRLKGRICLITGAARGIGATTARRFAQEGAAVALVDVKDELGRKVTADIKRKGGRALYLHCDVTNAREVEAMVATVLKNFKTIDVLFNNAGTAIEGLVDKLSETDWDKTFSINVKSMFLCSKYVIPILRRKGGGVIINQASESGVVGFPMHPAYCASKGAVINLTRSMALGHAVDKIRVNCICPGTIPTPLYHEFVAQLPNKDEVEDLLKREHPLGLGTEEDIANAALFLASDESRYMTGASLIVDGGYTAK